MKALEPDDVRDAKDNEAMWKKAVAKANAIAGFTDEPAAPENAVQTGWAKAITRVNALNGFAA